MSERDDFISQFCRFFNRYQMRYTLQGPDQLPRVAHTRLQFHSAAREGVSRTALFWPAFILTRPLGAAVGDFLDKPVANGGLAMSRYSASACMAISSSLALCWCGSAQSASSRTAMLYIFMDWVLHLDTHLAALAATNGLLVSGVLFGVIVIETGVVVLPFCPVTRCCS